MNQFYLKTITVSILAFLLVQQSSNAQSTGGRIAGDIPKTSSPHHASLLSVHPCADPGDHYITVAHPATGNAAQLKLVDESGKIFQQVGIAKNTRQTRMNITGLASGSYRIVWSDGARTLDQSLLMMQ